MYAYVYLMLLSGVSSFDDVTYPVQNALRLKREAVGSLDIITNNADPIHADVKIDNAQVYEDKVLNVAETYEQVTPPPASPASSPSIDLSQSRRKIHPFSNTLEIIRTISRLILLLVLLASAVIEFYPIIVNLFQMIYNLIYL